MTSWVTVNIVRRKKTQYEGLIVLCVFRADVSVEKLAIPTPF